MSRVGIVWLCLIVCLASVHAEDAALQANIDASNRFLAAETVKQLKTMEDEVIAKVNANNDENFRAFDQRMTDLELRTKQQVIVGGLGAILVANAFIGMAYLWVTRRYSYEKHLEKLVERGDKIANTELAVEEQTVSRQMAQMAQPSWQQQVPQQSVSTIFGQQAAAQQSMMNEWQYQPAYQGAWVPPQQPVSHVQWSPPPDLAEQQRQWEREQGQGGWQ